MLSSDLHRHQARKWCTHIRRFMHIEFKKREKMLGLPEFSQYVCEGVFPVISALGVEKGS